MGVHGLSYARLPVGNIRKNVYVEALTIESKPKQEDSCTREPSKLRMEILDVPEVFEANEMSKKNSIASVPRKVSYNFLLLFSFS